jgi:hypothetical protein
MMHGREKSDSAIVAGKPTNNAVPTAAEPVERRAGAKGNAHQQSTHRTQCRRHRRWSAYGKLCRYIPKAGCCHFLHPACARFVYLAIQ